jgi:hypothetical protein
MWQILYKDSAGHDMTFREIESEGEAVRQAHYLEQNPPFFTIVEIRHTGGRPPIKGPELRERWKKL